MPREFLVFRLWAPMAAWGDIAVGERRGSWLRPSRSAILGLVAAALGIARGETAKHDNLEDGLGFAVRVDDPGRPLRDYHTAQSPSSQRGVRWATRRDELDPDNDLNTILSERQYYLEMDAIVVLWFRKDKAPLTLTLEEIATALREPSFTLYLGRKSCPPGLPMKPHRLSAETPLTALHKYDEASGEEREKGPDITWGRPKPRKGSAREDWRGDVWIGEDDARAFGLLPPYRERTTRRDGIRDRGRWLFSDRAEVRIAQPTPPVTLAPPPVAPAPSEEVP